MNNYYVYAYIRLDNNSYFYIGKGKNNRCYELRNRSKHFMNIINSIPCAVEILYSNLNESDAFYLEKETIDDLIINEGYSLEIDDYKNEFHLVNCTYGGEGISGKHFKKDKDSIQKSTFYGKDNPMYGKRGELSPIYGRKYSDSHKEKIKLSNPRRKEIYCIELDMKFNSARECEKILLEKFNIKCSHASILSQCNNKIKSGIGKNILNNSKCNLHFKFI